MTAQLSVCGKCNDCSPVLCGMEWERSRGRSLWGTRSGRIPPAPTLQRQTVICACRGECAGGARLRSRQRRVGPSRSCPELSGLQRHGRAYPWRPRFAQHRSTWSRRRGRVAAPRRAWEAGTEPGSVIARTRSASCPVSESHRIWSQGLCYIAAHVGRSFILIHDLSVKLSV